MKPYHIFLIIYQKFVNNFRYFFLENQKNIIVVHCLAGKGRTGTVICCYLMYSGRMKTPEEALEYYAKKRFFSKKNNFLPIIKIN